MKENTRKILYWIVTGLLCFGMLSGGLSQLFQASWATPGFITLGYPLYMMHILGLWKVLGVIALLVPGFKLLKEWAYAGFFFLMTGAAASHLFAHDTLDHSIAAFISVLLVVASWYLRPQNRKIDPAATA